MENNQRLHAVLNGINAPLLELAFFETEQKQRIQNQFAERLPQKIITAIDDIEEKFSTQKNKTNIFGFNNPNGNNNGNNRPLKWENVSKNEKSYLLSYFATMSRNVGGYSNSERTKLKKMPIYPTVGGPCVALTNRSTTARNNNNNNNNTYYTFTPGTNTNSFPLSQESKSKVLERPVSRESQDLYEDLAVESLGERDVVQKFVLPDFNKLSDTEKEQVIRSIKNKWGNLKNDELIKAMETLQFIPNVYNESNVRNNTNNFGSRQVAFFSAKDLYDPENEILKSVFSDQPYQFPSGKYLQKDWLIFLREIGLKNEITANVYFKCANKLALDGQIQMRNNGYIDNELATKAGNLIIYFDAHFTELYSVESINRLRDIAFVPVVQPLSSASIIKNNNGRLKEKSDTNNDKNNDPTAAANAQRKVMVTFSACLLYGDRHLGWTQMPILPERYQIQHLVLKKIGLKTPPPHHVVMAHLQEICSDIDNGTLVMAYPDPPHEVFYSILRYFEKRWGDNMNELSPEHNREVNALRLFFRLPVGSLMIRPTRLYFRLTTNLAPFMFEVPRAFGAFEKMLMKLGASDKPLIDDYRNFLIQLKKETGNFQLNPNELNAVLKVIHLIVQSSTNITNGSDNKVAVPYVPDESGRLVLSSSCIYRNNPNLLRRIDESKMNFACWKMDIDTCRSLSIPSLSDVIIEEFVPISNNTNGDNSSNMEEQTMKERLLMGEDFTSFLRNNLFHKAVGIILNQLPDNGSNVANDGVDELKHHAELVSRKLSNFTVVFVDKIKSKFKMKFNVGKTLRRGTDVTRIGQQDDSSFYIDRKESKIVLALNKVKSNSIRVEQILSMAINEIFNFQFKDYPMVLDSLLSAMSKSIELDINLRDFDFNVVFETILRIHGISHDQGGSIERRRGQPGAIVTDEDREMLMLAPLRVFIPGEIVAIEGKDSSTNENGVDDIDMLGHPDDDNNNNNKQKKKNEPVLLSRRDAMSEQSLNNMHELARQLSLKLRMRYAVVVGTSDESGNTLKHVDLLIGPGGKRKLLLSSSVYSFQTSSSRKNDAIGTGSPLRRQRSSDDEFGLLRKVDPFRKRGGGGGGNKKDIRRDDESKGVVGEEEEDNNNNISSNIIPIESNDKLRPLDSAKYIKAVEDILAKVDLSIDSNQADLMAETLALRKEVETLRVRDKKFQEIKKEKELYSQRVADAFICKICMEREVDRLIVPSGKLICEECTSSLRGLCPFTRKRITQFVPFFNPLT